MYDGVHVEHRAGDTCHESTQRWQELERAMRGAGEAVRAALGYTIQLCDKPLFIWSPSPGRGAGGARFRARCVRGCGRHARVVQSTADR